MIVKDKTTCTPKNEHKLSAYFDYLRIKADHEKAGFCHPVLRNVTCSQRHLSRSKIRIQGKLVDIGIAERELEWNEQN